ncbi:MAG: hypothetical protein CMN55_08410 [Sneathiella sp.]|jgi:hypothetical protein|uniref:hypothetical protein n=1 Tax=Sneathiella sp. TaxID=1964365 RepID=UPI000C52AD2C|nr:hypothetical protein [Sneathiella sp.]MAL79119.1 hypothetical protein [Sneathiella sp.]|tara:strand:+ start:1568 stop:2149 length:582 start_codon:yes stop_codon:yes gene_type:complete
MEKNNPYFDIYDEIFFFLWDFTTGTARSKREAYKGARLYGEFLLSEISRYEQVKKEGEHAIERRGLVAPMSIMKAWTFNVLEDCFKYRITPPLELCHAIYLLMGCKHLNSKRGKNKEREAFSRLSGNVGIREASRKLGVNPTTILRWKNEPRQSFYPEFPGGPDERLKEYQRIRKLTNVEDFHPMKYRVLRTK